jgi:hypothetical protein
LATIYLMSRQGRPRQRRRMAPQRRCGEPPGSQPLGTAEPRTSAAQVVTYRSVDRAPSGLLPDVEGGSGRTVRAAADLRSGPGNLARGSGVGSGRQRTR